MKLNYLFLLSTFTIFSFVNGYSQDAEVSSEVRSNYPDGVVAQVFDIVVKTDLEASEQLTIAELIHRKDKSISTMLGNGTKYSDIVKTKIDFEEQINEALNTDQKYYKFVATTKEKAKQKYTYSQFAIAVRYKDSLGLKEEQMTSLLSEIATLKTMKNNHYQETKKSLDTRAYESEHISTILTGAQYLQLLIFKNKSKAESFAANDWLELQKRGLDSTYSKEMVIKELENYYLARECVYNRYQHDPIKQKSESREVYAHRPQSLRLLEKARRNPENNTGGRGYRW